MDLSFTIPKIAQRRRLGLTGNAPTPFPQHGLISWFDFSQADTVQTNQSGAIITVNNKIDGGMDLTSAPSGGPSYDPANAIANGGACAFWPDLSTNLGLALPEETPVTELFMVMAYVDGAADAFKNWTAFFATDSGTQMGHYLRDDLVLGSAFLDECSLNGDAPRRLDVLPMPLTVVRFSGTFQGAIQQTTPGQFSIKYFGCSLQRRSWRGPICEVLAYGLDANLNESDIADITAYLRSKWSI